MNNRANWWGIPEEDMEDNRTTKSGWWITWYLFTSVLVVFPVWEIIQLARKKPTMSKYVIAKAEQGDRFYRVAILAFPALIFVVSIWLTFHWLGLCINFGLFCAVDV